MDDEKGAFRDATGELADPFSVIAEYSAALHLYSSATSKTALIAAAIYWLF